ncbi:MAG: pilus assembly protein [Anaerolineae bacterium]|nr:pilus assembly protein [Anaerolineae bacterium]
MMKRSYLRRNQAGQATMEFLILLPLLLAVLVLIAYSGWWNYLRLSSQNYLYADCTAVSRSRGYLTSTRRGFLAAQNSRRMWQYESIHVIPEHESRLGAKDCQAVLRNLIPEDANGFWQFLDLVEAHGYAPYPPFMSCDAGTCK